MLLDIDYNVKHPKGLQPYSVDLCATQVHFVLIAFCICSHANHIPVKLSAVLLLLVIMRHPVGLLIPYARFPTLHSEFLLEILDWSWQAPV